MRYYLFKSEKIGIVTINMVRTSYEFKDTDPGLVIYLYNNVIILP